MTGSNIYSANTDNAGNFQVAGVLAGNYTLTPSKSDGISSITAYDASLVLQHSASLITLTGYAATSADVNESGAVSAMDASYILQKSAGLLTGTFPGSTSMWKFSPEYRTYSNLNTNQTAQYFAGLLLGEVSGNWTASAPTMLSTAAVMHLMASTLDKDNFVTVSLWLDPASAVAYSLDLTMTFNAEEVVADTVTPGKDTSNWMLAVNLKDPGSAQISMASAYPINQKSEFLKLKFQLKDPSTSSVITTTAGLINEGNITLQLSSVEIPGKMNIYLPLLHR